MTNALDPAQRYIEDARAIARDPNVPSDIRVKVLPGLCRMAIEAAARDAYFAREYKNGESVEVCEGRWSAALKVRYRLALALHNDPDADINDWHEDSPNLRVPRCAPAQLYWVEKRPEYRKRAIAICNSGVHDGVLGDPVHSVDAVSKAVNDLRWAK